MKVRRHERHATEGETLVPVLFPLEAGEWHGYDAEALWAEPLGDGRYLLRSPPFHAFDVAVEDVVVAHEEGGELRFDEVVERGGGSSYRVVLAKDAAEQLEALEALEVTCEAGGEIVALDVPPQADLDAVYAILAEGEEDGLWTFEEGHVAEGDASS